MTRNANEVNEENNDQGSFNSSLTVAIILDELNAAYGPPVIPLECLSFSEKEARFCYRYGKDPQEVERLDYPEFVARIMSHIPDKDQVKARYYKLYANAHRTDTRLAAAASRRHVDHGHMLSTGNIMIL